MEKSQKIIPKPMAEYPLLEPGGENLVLFSPHIPAGALEEVEMVLKSRWIGQGPRVDEFEQRFSKQFAGGRPAVAVGSGTDALHLAYLLAGLKPGDEVIAPIFTCVATNLPLLYLGVHIVFVDIQPSTLNLDPNDVRKRITPRTKAIVCVHYGGLPCDLTELQQIANENGLMLIEDAAQAVGASYKGRKIGELSDFTAFSFQAIKHITTGDGGMLVIKNPKLADKARRLRWFGIDRTAKQCGNWQNDIVEIGYKYQMTDLGAALGIAALRDFDSVLRHRREMFDLYKSELNHIPELSVIGGAEEDRIHAAWMFTVSVERREALVKMLRSRNIESAQVHYRNDRYSIFGGRLEGYPNMDFLEDRYLALPLHTKMTLGSVHRVCEAIRSGW